jgi:GcrA cell cycle regulator
VRDDPHLNWKPDVMQLLEELWAQHDIPISEIAKKIGVSTSAATCKAHRMKLPSRPSTTTGGRPRGIAETTKRKHVATSVRPVTPATINQPPPPPRPDLPLWMTLPTSPAKTCQFPLWPHNTPTPRPAKFCGVATAFGSWCAEHAGQVYTPAFKRSHVNDTA